MHKNVTLPEPRILISSSPKPKNASGRRIAGESPNFQYTSATNLFKKKTKK